MIDGSVDEKAKKAAEDAEPMSQSPPPIYGSPTDSQFIPPVGQSYPPQFPQPQPQYNVPSQFNPYASPPGQQGQPGQLPLQPGQPSPYGYTVAGQSYFPAQGPPLNPQHTGQLNPQYTGHPNPQLARQMSPPGTAQMLPPGQLPAGAGYPPQSPPMMQNQQQHMSVNYSPSGVPTVYLTPPPMQVQQQPNPGSQLQQELWARCARGEHDIVVRHGVAGIIAAILLFPIGLLCLFLDVQKKCSRCGAHVY